MNFVFRQFRYLLKHAVFKRKYRIKFRMEYHKKCPLGYKLAQPLLRSRPTFGEVSTDYKLHDSRSRIEKISTRSRPKLDAFRTNRTFRKHCGRHQVVTYTTIAASARRAGFRPEINRSRSFHFHNPRAICDLREFHVYILERNLRGKIQMIDR